MVWRLAHHSLHLPSTIGSSRSTHRMVTVSRILRYSRHATRSRGVMLAWQTLVDTTALLVCQARRSLCQKPLGPRVDMSTGTSAEGVGNGEGGVLNECAGCSNVVFIKDYNNQ